jgi:CheY-like chemotaxis protein
VEAGRTELDFVAFEPLELIDDAMELVAAKAREKGVHAVVMPPPGPTQVLLADPTRLRQVVVNLLSNAVKFTAAGEVVVHFEVVEQGEPQPGTRLRIVVRDTGIGMTEAQLGRLFQPFMQADASTARKFGGTGLGLAICKRLVDLMGGDIHVSSAPDRGTTFTVTVPTRLASESEAESVYTPAPPAEFTPPRRILVMHPHEATGRSVMLRFSRGFPRAQIILTRSVAAATQQMHGVPFELIVTAADEPAHPYYSAVRASLRPGRGVPAFLVLRGHLAPLRSPAEPDVLELVLPIRCSTVIKALRRLASPHAQLDARPEAPSPRVNLRVLVAEDNPVNARLALLTLEKLGHRADIVALGADALAQLGSVPYDCVLMDVQLPDMDGLEVTRRLRRLPGPAATTPVIALTASAMKGDRERCLAAGMNDYLTKPFALPRLEAALKRVAAARAPASAPSDLAVPPAAHSPAPVSAAPPAAAVPAVALDASDGVPLLERSLLQQLIDMDGQGATLRSLLDVFVAANTNKLAVIATSDVPNTVRLDAHSLRGSSAMLGLQRYSSLLLAVEKAAVGQRLPTAAEIAALRVCSEQSLQAVDDALRAHLSSLGPV